MEKKNPIVLAIHGGAGSLGSKQELSPSEQEAYKIDLKKALEAGYGILLQKGSCEQAVVTAIQILEDSELFNAGRGSVLNSEGRISMDAALMLGKNRDSGAVIGASTVKNPILLSQKILQHHSHNTFSESGADQFAKEQGLKLEPPSYFITERRRLQLMEAKKNDSSTLDHTDLGSNVCKKSKLVHSNEIDEKFGTVGAVALDFEGNLAAGTSTGGITNKRYGRVGDSPIIGAGTIADNRTCAISATGLGEEFIKHTFASEVHYQMLYKNKKLEDSMNYAVFQVLPMNTGGAIAVDKTGEISMIFNTPMMFRGSVNSEGKVYVGIYRKQE